MTDASRLAAMVRASPTLMRVLEHARDFALKDWLIASGAVYQTAWNAITGREPDYGLKDYDLFYYDSDDLSWDAEDRVIRRVRERLPEDLAAKVEVRNQARVHLWFEGRFGEPYPPLSSCAEALTRFTAPAFAVGVRLEPHGALHVEAPLGLADLFAMIVRPNPTFRPSASYMRIAEGMRARWPELTVEPPSHPPVMAVTKGRSS